MPYYEMFPQGIPASLKTEMNTVLNKKFGTTGQDYPTEDWPDDVNLLGLLEIKTASSAPICSFADGADDVPIKSWEVEIVPTLSGKSAIECTQINSDNLMGFPSVDFTYKNVRYYTVDGVLYLDGTSTGETSPTVADFKALCFTLKAGTYYFNRGALALPSYIYKKSDGTQLRVNNGSFTLSEDTECNLGFYVYNQSFSNKKADVCVNSGSTAITYEDTTAPTVSTVNLGRTIYGGTADVVNGTGTATWKKIVADGVNVKATGGYASGANRLPTIQVSDAVTTSTDIKADYLTTTSSVIGTEDTIMLGNSGTSIVLHIGTVQGNDGTHGYSSDAELLEACNSYLADHNLTIVYKLSDANATDFTFTPITPTPETALGVNNFWADEGDTEVTYRSSGTETIITPTLITKNITANGTYNAADDSADGYSSVTVNVPGVPSGSHEDPLNGLSAVKYNTGMVFSGFYIDNGTLKTELAFESRAGTGYEGFQIDLSNYNLVPGTNYEIAFSLYVPNDISFNGSYPWGVKYSSTAITNPAGSSFNITPDVDFLEQRGTQSVTMQFTASSNNYLLVLFSRYANGTLGKVTILRNITISEVTP